MTQPLIGQVGTDPETGDLLLGVTEAGFAVATGHTQDSPADPNLKINPTGCEFTPVWVEVHGPVEPYVVMDECRRVGAVNNDEGEEDYVVQFMVGPNVEDGYDAVPEERLIAQLGRIPRRHR
jgi:hypothetical protein